MLEDVHHKAYIRKNHERLQQEYCFVVTDGKGIIAIDTIGYNVPIRKSRLIPRQEQMVYEMVENVQAEKYEFQVEETEKEHHILSPSPFIMNGLTRKERQLKQLLFMALGSITYNEKYSRNSLLVHRVGSISIWNGSTYGI